MGVARKSPFGQLAKVGQRDFENAFKTNEIAINCRELSIDYIKLNNEREAIKNIKKSDEKIFLITGSLYLVGKLRAKILKI